MIHDRSEEQLRAEIRDLTAKLKQIREEIQLESRRHSSQPVAIDVAADGPRRRRPTKRR
jgi:hypothetical protein